MLRTYRAKIIALLLLVCGLAAGVAIWQAATRTTDTTSGTIGGGNVFTSANNVADCTRQASAFADYPLVWAGPSVLGYPLVYCNHSMTKTRYLPDGSVLHPGGDNWAFGYGTCETPKGRESCALPITIIIDPCALTIDGRAIPRGSRPVRGITVRGADADINQNGTLTFERAPQIISISTEITPYDPTSGQGVEAYTAEKAANAVKIAEALVPANALASPLSRGAPLTSAFAPAPDTLCRNSFVPAPPATAGPSPASATPPATAAPDAATPTPGQPPAPDSPTTLTITVGAPSLVNGKVQVPVSTTGSVSAAYAGFNVHLRWDSAVFSFSSANNTGSVLSSLLCPAPVPDSDGRGATYGCASTAAPISIAGLLATFVLTPAASGCSPLHLFTFGAPDGGDELTGTFTLAQSGNVLQATQYVDGSANVGGLTC